MPNQSHICQEGIVSSIRGNKAFVTIVSPSACDNCHTKSLCRPLDNKKRTIEAQINSNIKAGDRVTVTMEQRHGWTAVFYAFILPFICTIAAVMTAIGLGSSEIAAAVFGLIILFPYYTIIYIMRKKVSHGIHFTAEKT